MDTQMDERETSIRDYRLSVPEYSEIAEAIGQIALTWNSIHDTLSQIFYRVTGLNRDVAYAIWNAAKNDTTKRDILRAATKEVYNTEECQDKRQSILKILEDLQQLSKKRNSAIHCPFTVVFDFDSEEIALKVIPNYLSENKTAKKFSGRDVLCELRSQDRELECLKKRTQDIHNCL